MIKKRIEGLIEREYLARTPEDRYDRFSHRIGEVKASFQMGRGILPTCLIKLSV